MIDRCNNSYQQTIIIKVPPLLAELSSQITLRSSNLTCCRIIELKTKFSDFEMKIIKSDKVYPMDKPRNFWKFSAEIWKLQLTLLSGSRSVTRNKSPQNSTPAVDRDQPVSRRFEPSSRNFLTGEQPDPWELLHPQDKLSRPL